MSQNLLNNFIQFKVVSTPSTPPSNKAASDPISTVQTDSVIKTLKTLGVDVKPILERTQQSLNDALEGQVQILKSAQQRFKKSQQERIKDPEYVKRLESFKAFFNKIGKDINNDQEFNSVMSSLNFDNQDKYKTKLIKKLIIYKLVKSLRIALVNWRKTNLRQAYEEVRNQEKDKSFKLRLRFLRHRISNAYVKTIFQAFSTWKTITNIKPEIKVVYADPDNTTSNASAEQLHRKNKLIEDYGNRLIKTQEDVFKFLSEEITDRTSQWNTINKDERSEIINILKKRFNSYLDIQKRFFYNLLRSLYKQYDSNASNETVKRIKSIKTFIEAIEKLPINVSSDQVNPENRGAAEEKQAAPEPNLTLNLGINPSTMKALISPFTDVAQRANAAAEHLNQTLTDFVGTEIALFSGGANLSLADAQSLTKYFDISDNIGNDDEDFYLEHGRKLKLHNWSDRESIIGKSADLIFELFAIFDLKPRFNALHRIAYDEIVAREIPKSKQIDILFGVLNTIKPELDLEQKADFFSEHEQLTDIGFMFLKEEINFNEGFKHQDSETDEFKKYKIGYDGCFAFNFEEADGDNSESRIKHHREDQAITGIDITELLEIFSNYEIHFHQQGD